MKQKMILLLITGGMLTSASAQQPQAPDFDRDGVPDTQDGCPYTVPGSARIFKGCSALDLAENPDHVISPIQIKIKALQDRMRDNRQLDDAMTSLETAAREISSAETYIGQGDFNRGLSAFAIGTNRLTESLAVIQKVRDALKVEIDRQRPPYAPDQLKLFTDYSVQLTMAKGLQQDTLAGRQAFETLSRSVGGTRSQGKITRIDDSARRVEIDSRITVGLARGFNNSDPLYVGRDVVVNGPHFDATIGLATSIVGTYKEPTIVDAGIFENCLQVRVTPIQRREPGFNGPFTKHHLQAYKYADHHYLERGMGIAAEDVGCPDPAVKGAKRHSLEVKISYVPLGVWKTNVTEILAPDMDATDRPVQLPMWVSNGQYVGGDDASPILTITTRSQDTKLLGGKLLSELKILSVRTYRLKIFKVNNYCEARYSTTDLFLEDKDQVNFGTTSVSTIITVPDLGDPGSAVTFSALAYRMNGPQSSYPDAELITAGTPFAVYNHDFFTENTLYRWELTGVFSASGVKFPRVSGVKNGKPFAYSCSVPELVRDRLASCGINETPTSYRLPFQGESPAWQILKTHHRAFDFGAVEGQGVPQGSSVYAARGGMVIHADVSHANPFLNSVVVEHSDGTRAEYSHLNPWGAIPPALNTRVYRGDKIAAIGRTTDPDAIKSFVTLETWPTTSPFQLQTPGSSQIYNCILPTVGQPVKSNNY